MKVIADYHTHTRYSHGMGTIEENVLRALEKGIHVIGITDHGPGYLPYGMQKSKYKEMRQSVERLNEKYAGRIKILLGIEANIMDQQGHLDVDDFLTYSDIVLAGFHFDIICQDFLAERRRRQDKRQSLQAIIDPALYSEILAVNTQALLQAIHTYPIDILTHVADHQPVDLQKIAKAAGERKVALEINNFHRHPNVLQVQTAMQEEKVHFVLSSDAHRPRDVGNFTGAIKIMKKAGLDVKRVSNIQETEECFLQEKAENSLATREKRKSF